MLAVPYLALLVGGFLIYRGVKKNEEYRQRLRPEQSSSALAPGGGSQDSLLLVPPSLNR